MAVLSGSTERDFFFVLSERIVPEVSALEPKERERFLGIVSHALSTRSDSVHFQLKLFLYVLRWFPLFRFGAPLDRLSGVRQDRVLHWFMNNPISLFRKGFWGIKALVFMGYYGCSEVGEAIHYRPDLTGGNKNLHDA